MTVTFVDAQLPAKLPTANEPLDFTLDTDPVESVVSVEFPGVAWETVWQTTQDAPSGTFGPLYQGSSRVGSAFSVVRTGGWPGNVLFKLHVKEQSTVTSGVAALQSNLYGAAAMWALLNTSPVQSPPIIDGVDRSGNGRSMTTPNSLTVPDLIVGRASSDLGSNSLGFQLTGADATALAYLGAWTITARVAPRAYDSLAGVVDEWIYSNLNYGAGAPAGNCAGALLFGTSGGSKKLSYYCRNGSFTDVVFSMAAARPTDGAWHFVSCSRDASGTVVTLGLDGTYETSGALLPPTGATSTVVKVGTAQGASGVFQGGVADVCIWPVALTNTQVEVLRKQAMGL